MKKDSAEKQLSLWDDGTNAPAATPPQVQQPEAAPAHNELDLEAMRSWLLAWGEKHRYPGFSFPFHHPPRNEDADRRFGRVRRSKAGWEEDTQAPHNQFERYPGEWLEKCVEQVKRFDSGEEGIPYQVSYIADDTE